MKFTESLNAASQWVPFALRTAAYGTVSIALGPMTKNRGASLWAMRRWCRASAKGLNIEVEASGLEHVPPGAFVYCSNHQSIVDILCLGAVLPGDFKWAAKRSLMRIPFLGWHLRIAGHVPVDRRAGSRAAAEVIRRFVEVLGTGKPLLVFPEGTRSEDGAMRPFKPGGFYAAVRAGVPVVPVAIEGTYKLMRRGAADTGAKREVRRVVVRVGAPLVARAEGKEGQRVADLKDRTQAEVAKLLRSIGGDPGLDALTPTAERGVEAFAG